MPKIYYQAAKLLAENFNQDENAIECLENILSDYPEQPQAEEAKKYLKILYPNLMKSIRNSELLGQLL